MKMTHGWYLPDHEKHLIEWMSHPKNAAQVVDGRVMYQAVKQRRALELCKSFRTAIDIGAHCGLWSFYLDKRFKTVEAFEPIAGHRECFMANLGAPVADGSAGVLTKPDGGYVRLHAIALGAEAGHVGMFTEQGSSGNSHVDGAGDIEMRTLDSFEFLDVDFVKIDTEGFELYILQGAVETLKRCKPVLCVEQKSHVIGNFGFKSPEAITFLQSLGAVVLQEISGDYIMGFPQ